MFPKLSERHYFTILFIIGGIFVISVVSVINENDMRQFEENKDLLQLITNKGFSVGEGTVRSPSIIYTVTRDEFIELLNTENLANEIVFSSSGNDYNALYAFSSDYQISWSVQIGYWQGDLEF